ncbi:MAG: CoA transferase subunit A [Bacillota bacterium]
MVQRKTKLSTVSEAADLIQDGMTIGIGGFMSSNHSMVIIREIIRRGIRNLTVFGCPSSGIELDMLIGAGCVKKVIAAYVGGEWISPLLPHFRRAAEKREIEIWECGEMHQYLALMAHVYKIPFMPTRDGLGTDHYKVNPDFKFFNDPFTDQRLVAIPAIGLDVALIHAGCADVYGNCQHPGATFGDRIYAKAAEKVIVTVDMLLSNDFVADNWRLTTLHGYQVDSVVHEPFGAHPSESHGIYIHDEEHMREYVRVAQEGTIAFERYLKKYVLDPTDHVSYLEAVGGVSRLLYLKQGLDAVKAEM